MLSQAVVWVIDTARIWRCCGCGVGLGTSICSGCGPKKGGAVSINLECKSWPVRAVCPEGGVWGPWQVLGVGSGDGLQMGTPVW